MRILFVSDTYFPHINGVYYFVCRIGPLLQQSGHEVGVVAPSSTTQFTRTTVDGLDVFGIPSVSIRIYPKIRVPIPFSLKKNLQQIIGEFRPDIIHIQDHFSICAAVVRMNRTLKIPMIATNHFMPENLTVLVQGKALKKIFENFLWKGFSKVFNEVSVVTTPTETGARLIRSRLRSRVMAISSGISLDEFSPWGNTANTIKKYGIPKKPVLLYVGRLDPEKHIGEILQAVASALSHLDFCLLIVGTGISKTSLEIQSRQLGISDHVIFTGFVPDEDLPFLYRLSHCFIIASIAELLSLSTLQAMATGLPVIAVNAGALGEMVKDQQNGYLFGQGDIRAITAAVLDILSNPDKAVEMGRKSLEFIQSHDIHNTTKQFESLYHSSLRLSPPHEKGVAERQVVQKTQLGKK